MYSNIGRNNNYDTKRERYNKVNRNQIDYKNDNNIGSDS